MYKFLGQRFVLVLGSRSPCLEPGQDTPEESEGVWGATNIARDRTSPPSGPKCVSDTESPPDNDGTQTVQRVP